MVTQKMREGMLFTFQDRSMTYPQTYIVANCNHSDKNICYELRAINGVVNEGDLWMLTQKYFNQLIRDSIIKILH